MQAILRKYIIRDIHEIINNYNMPLIWDVEKNLYTQIRNLNYCFKSYNIFSRGVSIKPSLIKKISKNFNSYNILLFDCINKVEEIMLTYNVNKNMTIIYVIDLITFLNKNNFEKDNKFFNKSDLARDIHEIINN